MFEPILYYTKAVKFEAPTLLLKNRSFLFEESHFSISLRESRDASRFFTHNDDIYYRTITI